MIRASSLIFFLLFGLATVNSQVTGNSPNKERFYDTVTMSSAVTSFSSDGLFNISLFGDFNDSCRIFLNDSLVYNGWLQTNPLLGHTGKTIIFSRNSYPEAPVLHFIMINKKYNVTETLDFNYPIVEIRFINNRWLFTYTRRFADLE